jgi:4-amino-4-deoxy-L-arabinose transferase-like glycosyltransferase
MGTLGLLYRWVVLLVMGLTVLLCSSAWIELFHEVSSAFRKEGRGRWKPMSLVLLTIVILSPILVLPLYPPTAFDSTMYHLAYSKIYVQAHAIVFTPYLRFPVFPQTNEMLFTFAMLLCNGVSAQLIQFLMMGVLVAGLFAFGKRHFSPRTGVWAGAIFLSNPMVLWLGTSAYIDMGLALFVTMAIYSIINWIDTKEKGWSILGALFLGFSVGSKYSALFFLILFSLVALAIGFRTKKFLLPLSFIGIAVGIAFPWYFRNWYYTGNPVFPFLGKIFGHGLFSDQDMQGMLNDLLHAHGMGKSLQSLLLLPWNLTIKQTEFLMEAPYSKIYLFALPFLLLSLRRPRIRNFFLIVLLYTLFWFSSAQILRYLMPIIPLLSLITAASIEHCLGYIFPRRLGGASERFVILVVLVALIIPGWLYAAETLRREGFPPSNKIAQADYLVKKLPSFPAYQYLNLTKGRNYTVYALFDANMAYFSDGTFMGDWFGPGRYEKIYKKYSDVNGLHRELQLLKAGYLLIKRGKVPIETPSEDFFSEPYFRLAYKNEHVLLFEVLE